MLSHLCCIQRRILNLSSVLQSTGVSLPFPALLSPEKYIFTRMNKVINKCGYCALQIPTQEMSSRIISKLNNITVLHHGYHKWFNSMKNLPLKFCAQFCYNISRLLGMWEHFVEQTHLFS